MDVADKSQVGHTHVGAVVHMEQQPVVDRGNGNRTIPLIGPGTGALQMINGITEIAPGSAIPEHFHNCEESILILSGNAIAVIGGTPHEMKASDASWVPAGVPHFFKNASEVEPLRIFWTYASVEATRTSVASGETRPIAAEHRKLVQAP
jgi:putative monooxygenase